MVEFWYDQAPVSSNRASLNLVTGGLSGIRLPVVVVEGEDSDLLVSGKL